MSEIDVVQLKEKHVIEVKEPDELLLKIRIPLANQEKFDLCKYLGSYLGKHILHAMSEGQKYLTVKISQ